jgi:hypothetical protein
MAKIYTYPNVLEGVVLGEIKEQEFMQIIMPDGKEYRVRVKAYPSIPREEHKVKPKWYVDWVTNGIIRSLYDDIPVYSRADMIKVFGNPDHRHYTDDKGKKRVAVSSVWEGQNFTLVKADYITGYHKKLYMHKKARPYFQEAMNRANEICPDYKFERIGCFNPRHIRYDFNRPLSDHTWGIAFDINASKNRAITRTALTPKPFEPGWSKVSDFPEEVIAAFESVGFEWGGRWGTEVGGFVDSVHFSLRHVR